MGVSTGGSLTTTYAPPRLARLGSLTGLRFYAALIVLLKHAVAPIFPAPILLQLSDVGSIGVGFFFVLSGFVMAWSWMPENQTRDFFVRRAARIVPLHVLTTALAMVVLFANGTPYWLSSILSLLLVQAWLAESYRSGGNTPSWSLSCEAFFYACFPTLIRKFAAASIQGCYRIVALVFVAMIVWNGAYAALTAIEMPAVTALATYTNPAYRIGEFVIGMTIGIAVRQGWRSRIGLRSAIAISAAGYAVVAASNHAVIGAGIGIGGSQGIPIGLQDLAYLPATMMLVAAAATSDIEGRPSPVAGKWHAHLGQWSFALYLIQAVVIGLVVEAVVPSSAWWTNAIWLVGTLSLCVALSGALYQWVEKPAEAFLRRRSAGARSHPIAASAAESGRA